LSAAALALVLALALVVLASAAQAQVRSDWELKNEDRLKQSQEQGVAPPALDRARLVEVKLHVSADSEFRYYVDPASVSVGADRIVRYVLIGRSASGAENVSFEGIRCPGEYRVYAVGRPDGSWAGRPSEWRPIPRHPNASQAALARQYFCPGRHPILTSDEGQQALRAGGHPGVFPGAR
jgi:CNP1-like family protein